METLLSYFTFKLMDYVKFSRDVFVVVNRPRACFYLSYFNILEVFDV